MMVLVPVCGNFIPCYWFRFWFAVTVWTWVFQNMCKMRNKFLFNSDIQIVNKTISPTLMYYLMSNEKSEKYHFYFWLGRSICWICEHFTFTSGEAVIEIFCTPVLLFNEWNGLYDLLFELGRKGRRGMRQNSIHVNNFVYIITHRAKKIRIPESVENQRKKTFGWRYIITKNSP